MTGPERAATGDEPDMSEPVDGIVDELTRMRMNVQGGHASPHKAVMMLAVIDMVASGDAAENSIHYGPELLEHFQRYFDVVKTDADSCTPLNPFWHLKSEPFWHHKVRQVLGTYVWNVVMGGMIRRYTLVKRALRRKCRAGPFILRTGC